MTKEEARVLDANQRLNAQARKDGEAPVAALPLAPVPAVTASPEDVRILVGWLLDIVLRKGVGQHELDAQLVVHAAKVFLGKDGGEQS